MFFDFDWQRARFTHPRWLAFSPGDLDAMLGDDPAALAKARVDGREPSYVAEDIESPGNEARVTEREH